MGILVEDTFTEATTIDLAAHTPSPTGTAWAELEDTDGSKTIINHSSDHVRISAVAANNRILYECTPIATDADVDVEASINATSTTNATRAMFLLGRIADKDNLLGGICYDPAAAADKKLFEKVSGTPAELASGDTGLATGDVIKVEVRGTTIKLYQDTGGGYSEILSSTTTVTTAGKGGLGFGNILSASDDASAAQRWDDFKLTEFAAAGGATRRYSLPLTGVG